MADRASLSAEFGGNRQGGADKIPDGRRNAAGLKPAPALRPEKPARLFEGENIPDAAQYAEPAFAQPDGVMHDFSHYQLPYCG
jgi:hypothetical protein